MSNVLISVGMHQLISFFYDDEDELLPPQAAKVTADSKVTAPNPTRFQFEVIFINGSS